MLVVNTPVAELLSSNPKVVAIDTFVLRELMHAQKGAEPFWYRTFIEAKGNGFSFCLTPYALLELTNQLKEGRVSQGEFLVGMELANEFIEPRLPICPDWKELLFLAGLNPACARTVQAIAAESIERWKMLKDPAEHSRLTSAPVETMLEQTRKAHRETIATVKKDFARPIDFEMVSDKVLATLGSKLNLSEQDSQRLRLVTTLSIHFAEASLQGTKPYNELSDKSRNDGIDRWLPLVLLLPAYLVTEAKWMNIARAKAPEFWQNLVLTTAEFKRLYDTASLPDLGKLLEPT